MPSATRKAPAKRSAARDRLLAAATQLFYAEGINGVGVDRIVAASNVTLATFYRHFPSKQDLVVAYLQGVHEALVARAADSDRVDGRERIGMIGAEVMGEVGYEGFRGCAFLNVASEFEDAESPVRQVVADHRRWFHDRVRRAFADAGHKRPGDAARHFVMLRDGAVTAGYLDSPTTAQRTFKRGVDGLVRSIDLEPLPGDGDEEA
ncbi:MAG TPA: TetR/AcrR family transcriptional regulator [Solirubrobacterales bacterium]